MDALKLERTVAAYLPPEKVKEPSEGDAAVQAHEDTEFSDRFAGIDGIDVKTALKNCMNTDILKNTVHDFYVSAKTKFGEAYRCARS